MSPHRVKGVTLLELLVVLVIVGIMVTLATPEYRIWMANTRVRGAAESIQNGLRVARNEAAQRGVPVRFEMGSSDASWTVCELAAGSSTCTGGTNIEKHAVADTASVVITSSKQVSDLTTYGSTLSGTPPGGVTFSALGRPQTADYGSSALLRIDTSSAIAGTRRLVTTISAGGSIFSCDPGVSKTAAASGCADL